MSCPSSARLAARLESAAADIAQAEACRDGDPAGVEQYVARGVACLLEVRVALFLSGGGEDNIAVCAATAAMLGRLMALAGHLALRSSAQAESLAPPAAGAPIPSDLAPIKVAVEIARVMRMLAAADHPQVAYIAAALKSRIAFITTCCAGAAFVCQEAEIRGEQPRGAGLTGLYCELLLKAAAEANLLLGRLPDHGRASACQIKRCDTALRTAAGRLNAAGRRNGADAVEQLSGLATAHARALVLAVTVLL